MNNFQEFEAKSNRAFKRMALWIGLSFAIVVFVSIGYHWILAGVQAQVYQRQGIQMSQWEVFLGAKPAEKIINIRELEKK